jgi:hypothetical protein
VACGAVVGAGAARDASAILGRPSSPPNRGRERLQVRVAREARVDGLELPGSPEEQRRGVTAPSQSERDLSAQPFQGGSLEVVERVRLRRGQQPEGRLRRSRREPRLGRGEHASGAPGGIAA